MMNIGNGGPRVQSIAMNVGDSGVRVRSDLTSVGNGSMRVCPKLGLEAEVQRWLHGSDRTHVERKKNLIEALFPSSDCLFIVLRVETSGERVSPAPALGDVLLDLRNSPTIESLVSKSHGVVPLVQLT